MRPLLLTVLLGGLAMQAAAQTKPVRIELDHLTLKWDLDSGLTVWCDGRMMLGGSVSPVVAYPPGWAWSHRTWGSDMVSVEVERTDSNQVLRIICRDDKVWWKQVVTAYPGDRFSIGYWFTQTGWGTPLNSEVCLCTPVTSWFAGATYKVNGPAGPREGQIPLQYEGVDHPFASATEITFDALYGTLSISATAGLTLYDYAHRSHFWLGRDAAWPQGQQQHWEADFAFEAKPFDVAGLRLANLRVPDRTNREVLDVSFDLSRLQDGPETVTARLVHDDPAVAESVETTVRLTDGPAAVKLALPLPGPGRQTAHLELLAAGEVVYRAPSFSFEVPRLLTLLPGRVPFARGEQGLVLANADEGVGEGIRLVLESEGRKLAEGPALPGKRTEMRVPLDRFPLGFTTVRGTLYRGAEKLGSATCEVLLAEPNPNGVAIDHRSHTLRVKGLPFVPQAAYADIQSVDEMIEQEAQQGFNLVSPYLSNDIATRRASREQFRRFMDRCAQLGIYVQLGMLLASHEPQDEEKWAFVKEEVEYFRDHPALLTYYLADEPELGWATPEQCEAAYRRLKELDPWHPVTMVFCQSAAALRYSKGMDICMTDPYPIPNGPITQVVDFCERIRGDLSDCMPLWVVPQAFGGGEWWRREPSRQEERAMTYLALIHGARGIQYFIRRPIVGNPTSPDLWSECRRLMLELSQLVPALSSPEAAPEVSAAQPQVHVAAFRERGALTVLCANVANEPLPLEVVLEGLKWSGSAEVLFENRQVAVMEGRLVDTIEPFGTRAYRLQVDRAPADLATLADGNLVFNPSFEEAHNTGTPDGSYLSTPQDKGASWYLDPRTAAHGRQSLRLQAPADGQSIGLRPFPITLEAGKRYRLSVWARGERPGQRMALTLDAVDDQQGTHVLSTEWQEYAVEFTASEGVGARSQIGLRLLSAGAAWFDALQVVPIP
ncbi:MAG: hypothetical protein HPY69_13410 [Armatimonadetes bacterium]|nr:hypothetical protein [Armatimonadota bacterium]